MVNEILGSLHEALSSIAEVNATSQLGGFQSGDVRGLWPENNLSVVERYDGPVFGKQFCHHLLTPLKGGHLQSYSQYDSAEDVVQPPNSHTTQVLYSHGQD